MSSMIDTSSDEKVLKVTPQGKWTVNDEFSQCSPKESNNRPGMALLITAVGPGRAKVIVSHCPYEDLVAGIIGVEPCSEWKKTALKFDLPIGD